MSELNIKDDLFVFHHLQMQQEVSVSQNGGMADMISTGDVHHFEKHRNELFDAVGGLNGLVRCICVLGKACPSSVLNALPIASLINLLRYVFSYISQRITLLSGQQLLQ